MLPRQKNIVVPIGSQFQVQAGNVTIETALHPAGKAIAENIEPVTNQVVVGERVGLKEVQDRSTGSEVERVDRRQVRRPTSKVAFTVAGEFTSNCTFSSTSFRKPSDSKTRR